MKRHFFLYLFLFVFQNTHAQSQNPGNFILTGEVIGRVTGIISLQYINALSQIVSDTTFLKNGVFTFSGKISEPTPALIIGDIKSTLVDDPNRTIIFLEPGKLTITLYEGNFNNDRMDGSFSQRQFDSLNAKLNPSVSELKNIGVRYSRQKLAYSKGNRSPSLLDSIKEDRSEISPLNDVKNKIYYGFVSSHPNSYVSAYTLAILTDLSKLPEDSAKRYYESLSTKIQKSYFGTNVKHQITNNIRIKHLEGMNIPDSGLADINGRKISFYKLRGHYFLLDFWATWCVPCHEFAPYLDKLYKTYKDKGLQVVRIDCWDRNRHNWEKAIKKDGFTGWTNIYVFNPTESSSNINEKLGVEFIPTVILVDDQGRYYKSFTETDDKGNMPLLAEKLAEIFKQH